MFLVLYFLYERCYQSKLPHLLTISVFPSLNKMMHFYRQIFCFFLSPIFVLNQQTIQICEKARKWCFLHVGSAHKWEEGWCTVRTFPGGKREKMLLQWIHSVVRSYTDSTHGERDKGKEGTMHEESSFFSGKAASNNNVFSFFTLFRFERKTRESSSVEHLRKWAI